MKKNQIIICEMQHDNFSRYQNIVDDHAQYEMRM